MNIPCVLPACRVAAVAVAVALPPATLAAQPAGPISPAAAQRIDSIANAELATTRTPGSALAIVQGDRVVYAKGYGLANVETNQPVTPDLIFRLGSTTKMMTSLAALSLAARGVVELDRPIAQYAPAITSQRLRTVTLRQLLTHTAGLLDYTSMMGPHDDEAMNAFVPTLTDSVFFTTPGDIMSYSNLGYVVAGYVMSVASRKPYADVMRDEVFGPLGMSHSTMRPIEAMTFPLAQGHQGGRGGGAMQIMRPAPDDSRYWPAGSAFTSVIDFARLAAAMLNDGRVEGQQAIPAAVIHTWVTPFVTLAGDTTATPGRYGFGLGTRSLRGETLIEHGGSRAGYGSMFRVIPGRKLAVIVLGNQSGIALRRTMDAATAAVAPGLESDPPPPRTTPVALSPEAKATLAGSYRNSRGTGMDLVAEGGQLKARPISATGNPNASPVERIGTNWYVAGNSRFAIVTGADGKSMYLVTGMRAMRKQQP